MVDSDKTSCQFSLYEKSVCMSMANPADGIDVVDFWLLIKGSPARARWAKVVMMTEHCVK
jgi:hypothetical protein